MAHIYVYSPSGAVRDKAGFRRATKHLADLGHEIQIDPDALTSYQRFAGSDEVRLAAINRAADSRADLVLMTRGGYGLTRILPAIDYKKIAQSVARGTQWMGFSDFTALQAALWQVTQSPTISGATLIADFGIDPKKGEVDDITQACFEDVLLKHNEGTGWRVPQQSSRKNVGNQSVTPFSLENTCLWGGNLTVLSSLIGTPYFPCIEGGILWFEDTGETPFRVERMLTQWLHSGLLARQKAIIFGQFTDYALYSHDKGFNLASVVTWLRQQLAIPVLTGLPFGHVATKVMLPFGVSVRLLYDGREAVLLWD